MNTWACWYCEIELKNCAIMNCKYCEIFPRYCFRCGKHRGKDVLLKDGESEQ